MIMPLSQCVYEGKIYECGAEILLTEQKYKSLKGAIEYGAPVVFIHREGEYWRVYGEKNGKYYNFLIKPNSQYIKEIISAPIGEYRGRQNNNIKTKKKTPDYDRWALYIFLMALATFFYGNWFLWILLTIFIKPHDN